MRAFPLFLLPLLLLAPACESTTGIDVSGYDPIPEFEHLDFGSVQPAEAVDYWELRFAFRECFSCSSPPDSVIGSGGPLSRQQLDAATIAALDQLQPESGFAHSCLPGNCFQYIAAVKNGITVYTTPTALQQFLGAIDTREDALLLLRGNNYYWQSGSRDTGMKEIEGGWQFIVLQMVKFCAPVQTDRVLFTIDRDGLHEMQREVWSRQPNACV